MPIRVNPADLSKRLERLAGERNPFTSARRLAQVESYIEKEFANCGLNVEGDSFNYRGWSYRNIVGRARAPSRAPLIVLGAHFDSVEGTPGADDNASGVAVLLEAARLLARAPLKHQLFLCAFNLEEQNMIGSAHLARKLKESGAEVSAMVSLEMVGFTDPRPGSQKYPTGLSWLYPERGDFIGVIGNWHSYSLLKKFSRSMQRVNGLPVETLTVLGNGFLVPQVRLSDHAPFWDLGYRALLVTDTSFFRNPNYHKASDTVETLNFDFMAKVCEGVVTAVLNL